MNGYLEFGNGPWVKVRIGPCALHYPDPYIFGVTCTIDGDLADPGPFSTTPITKEVVETLRRLLHEAELKLQWTRRKGSDPYLMREQTGVNGELRMAKKVKINDISVIFNADGTLNEGKGMSGLQHFLHQMRGGHYSVVNGKTSTTPVAGVPGAVDITISFRRLETDPKEVADPAPAL